MMKLKKILKLFCIIFLLIILLAVSYYNYDIGSLNYIYATITDQSSTNSEKQTDQSSTTNMADMVDILARVINAEARGEPYKGQVAVGAVIMNRVKSAEFPNTISGVIYQANQFSCVTNGQINISISTDSIVYKAATEAMNGSDPTGGALFFYNAKTTNSKWLYTRKTVAVIGNHTFAM